MISLVSVIDQWGLSSRTLIGLKPNLLLLLFYLPVNLSDFELSLLLRLKSTEQSAAGDAERTRLYLSKLLSLGDQIKAMGQKEK